MEFNKLIKDRRSIRAYKDENVKKKDIEKIIKTTLLAPSWKNTETGRYYAALSKEAKEVVYNALPDFNKNASKNASYIIATYKKNLSGVGHGDKFTDNLKNSWGAYDLGLQNSYLILQAKELGYDTLIMGLRDEKALRKYFKIDKDEIMMPVIAIGKKNIKAKLNKRKEVKEVLHTF